LLEKAGVIFLGFVLKQNGISLGCGEMNLVCFEKSVTHILLKLAVIYQFYIAIM
jgi:hypothetical protein